MNINAEKQAELTQNDEGDIINTETGEVIPARMLYPSASKALFHGLGGTLAGGATGGLLGGASGLIASGLAGFLGGNRRDKILKDVLRSTKALGAYGATTGAGLGGLSGLISGMMPELEPRYEGALKQMKAQNNPVAGESDMERDSYRPSKLEALGLKKASDEIWSKVAAEYDLSDDLYPAFAEAVEHRLGQYEAAALEKQAELDAHYEQEIQEVWTKTAAANKLPASLYPVFVDTMLTKVAEKLGMEKEAISPAALGVLLGGGLGTLGGGMVTRNAMKNNELAKMMMQMPGGSQAQKMLPIGGAALGGVMGSSAGGTAGTLLEALGLGGKKYEQEE